MFWRSTDTCRKWTQEHFMGERNMVSVIPSESEDSELEESQEEWIPESGLRDS